MILPTPELLTAVLTFSAEKQKNPYTLGIHYDGGHIKVNEFTILNIDKTLTFNKLTIVLDHKHHTSGQPDVVMIISINIYELMHLMLDYARTNKFRLVGWYPIGKNKNYKVDIHNHNGCVLQLLAPTMPEAVTKACEWILNNKA